MAYLSLSGGSPLRRGLEAPAQGVSRLGELGQLGADHRVEAELRLDALACGERLGEGQRDHRPIAVLFVPAGFAQPLEARRAPPGRNCPVETRRDEEAAMRRCRD